MRKAVVLLFGVFAASIALADVKIDIGAPFGIWLNANDVLPAGASYQIIWSADNVYMPANTDLVAANAGDMIGGDYVVYEGVTTMDGGFSANQVTLLSNAVIGGTDLRSGYMYGYVYNAGANGTVDVGDYYGATAIYNTADFRLPIGEPAPLANSVNFADQSALVLDTFQVVPEPSTMGLIALGALTLAGRRMRRNKK